MRLSLSDFKLVPTNQGRGKLLRFSFTWRFVAPSGDYAQTQQGWIAKRGTDGVLVVSPPLTQTGSNMWAKKTYTSNSDDLEGLIVKELEKLPFINRIGYQDIKYEGDGRETFDDIVSVDL